MKMDSDLQVDARYRDGDGATQSRVHAEGHVARLRQSLAADITRALEASEMRMSFEYLEGLSLKTIGVCLGMFYLFD